MAVDLFTCFSFRGERMSTQKPDRMRHLDPACRTHPEGCIRACNQAHPQPIHSPTRSSIRSPIRGPICQSRIL